jgi:hypothetical protein
VQLLVLVTAHHSFSQGCAIACLFRDPPHSNIFDYLSSRDSCSSTYYSMYSVLRINFILPPRPFRRHPSFSFCSLPSCLAAVPMLVSILHLPLSTATRTELKVKLKGCRPLLDLLSFLPPPQPRFRLLHKFYGSLLRGTLI